MHINCEKFDMNNKQGVSTMYNFSCFFFHFQIISHYSPEKTKPKTTWSGKKVFLLIIIYVTSCIKIVLFNFMPVKYTIIFWWHWLSTTDLAGTKRVIQTKTAIALWKQNENICISWGFHYYINIKMNVLPIFFAFAN